MQIDLSHPDFQAAIPILQQIESAGYEAYFVGGSVRDTLLGLPIHDVDIASSAYPEEIKKIFKKTVDTGIQHGTVMVLDHGSGYEVTTFRTESTYQDFRRPDHVTFVRSLAEDLKRRDFTVNALAVRHDGTVIDMFGGLDDLAKRRLKAVGDPHARFHEDALRMMRAVRFESQLDFSIEPATQAAIKENSALLEKIAVERIANEFTRLLAGIARTNGLKTMLDTDLYLHVPLFAAHKAGLAKLAALSETQIKDPAVLWTLVAACLDLPAAKMMKAWKQANALLKTVQGAQDLLAKLPDPTNWDLFSAGAAAVNAAAEAQAFLAPGFVAQALKARFDALTIHASRELALSGSDLMQVGVKPGPKLGKTLQQLTQQVVAGSLANDKTTLMQAAKDLA